MQIALLALNALIMLVFPLVVATFIARRYRAEWGLFGAGALTFVVSQILHIPFNGFVESRFLPTVGAGFSSELFLVAAFYGLSAGVFEEVGRYLTYRFWRKDARQWKDGLMLGAGHGGIEAIILGVLFTINMAVLLGMDRGYFTALAPEGGMGAVEAQIDALMALPWYETILGGVERILAVILHLGLSLIVLRAVRNRALIWLFIAIFWHATFNGVALVVATFATPIAVEGMLAGFALLSLLLIWRLKDQPAIEGAEVEREPAAPMPPIMEQDDIADKLNESRYL